MAFTKVASISHLVHTGKMLLVIKAWISITPRKIFWKSTRTNISGNTWSHDRTSSSAFHKAILWILRWAWRSTRVPRKKRGNHFFFLAMNSLGIPSWITPMLWTMPVFNYGHPSTIESRMKPSTSIMEMKSPSEPCGRNSKSKLFSCRTSIHLSAMFLSIVQILWILPSRADLPRGEKGRRWTDARSGILLRSIHDSEQGNVAATGKKLSSRHCCSWLWHLEVRWYVFACLPTDISDSIIRLDFILGRTFDDHGNMTKARKYGWTATVDTSQCYLGCFDRLKAMKIIPSQ